MLEAFPFKPVDPLVIAHPLETRGFVTVPFDYAKPEGDAIQVFYRLIPSYANEESSRPKPVMVVINGGPGVSSKVYRPLEFDYEHLDSEVNGPLNRFLYLLHDFRVLIVDQRGTDGCTTPLDMENPKINANGIAHYFSSDSQARDYAEVIKKVIPQGEPFYIIAQSYGGMVGMQYLSQSHSQKPAGIIFSCSALPHEDLKDAMMSRRAEQLKLNHELKAAVPSIESELSAVRSHFKRIGLDPGFVHSVYTLLGKGEAGKWEPALSAQLKKMLTQDRASIEKEISANLGGVSLLNYILSSANFTPGFTDRTIGHLTSAAIPFESWMLDENWMLDQTGEDIAWKTALVKAMDESPPPATQFASINELRAAIEKNQVLFTAADNDAFVPKESYLRAVEKFLVPGHTTVKTLPGGHAAIFLEEGLKELKAWIAQIRS